MAERPPWLRHFDDADAVTFVEELTEFVCRPAFGSRSKRETELKVFELLYRRAIEDPDVSVSVGRVAADLAVSRSRARSLILDARARYVGEKSAGERDAVLRAAARKWPSQVHFERDGERLKFVIDDPFIRDLLRNYAYDEGVALDSSFSGEIVTLTWPGYIHLVRKLEGVTDEDAENDIAARIRSDLFSNVQEKKAFDKELTKLLKKARTREERLRAIGQAAVKVGGPAAQLLKLIAGGGP